jgi:hypothetical protein
MRPGFRRTIKETTVWRDIYKGRAILESREESIWNVPITTFRSMQQGRRDQPRRADPYH